MDNFRSRFQVLVYCQNRTRRKYISESLESVGYNTQLFEDTSLLLEEFRAQPTSILLVDIVTEDADLSDLFAAVRLINVESSLLVLVDGEDPDEQQRALEFGASDVVLWSSFGSIALTLRVDRVAELSYVQQKRQLAESKYLELHAEITLRDRNLAWFESQLDGLLSMSQLIRDSQDMGTCFQNLANWMSAWTQQGPVCLFRFIASHRSLPLQISKNLPIDPSEGLGVDLSKRDPKTLLPLLRSPSELPELRVFLDKMGFVEDRTFLCLELTDGQIYILVFVRPSFHHDSAVELIKSSLIREIELKQSQLRLHLLENKDSQTEAYLAKGLHSFVADEVSRSRRIKHPLSVIAIEIDDFKSYNERNGIVLSNVLLRKVVKYLLRASRANDRIFNLGGGRLVMVLPHTSRVGAAIKSEKIRRAISQAAFPMMDHQPLGHLSLSIGVSEFPNLSSDADALVESAQEALDQVMSRSKNKVCIYVVDEAFRPEFKSIESLNEIGGPSSGRGTLSKDLGGN
ncbi:MAG: hypothetical protein COT74_06895 [Bdellovibrionales bacterium CG10_big_fil_rev_8_21_14_0_10_45_34]|nr:MAG: hypothetical protein COT74_06895 [Bdellovibrionales bacterium CG10_big_fil_rev_8_21_14_0_10_45_34]